MPDALFIELYKDDDTPLYVQIADALRARVRDGRLRSGDRLPSVRRLSDELGVNPATIVAAYNILGKEAVIEARPGSGAYVAESLESTAATDGLPAVGADTGNDTGTEPGSIGSKKSGLSSQPDRFAPEPGGRPESDTVIDFSANAPPRHLFPLGDVKRFLVEAVDVDGGKAFEYQDANGYEPLRIVLAERLPAWRGQAVHRDTVHIVSGAQQGLDLVARLVLRRGDLAVVESPGYRGVRDVFIASGARVEAVAIRPDGLDLDALQRLAETRPLRLVYTNPVLQNPTTALWSEEKKQRLVSLAVQYGFYIIEDDSFADLLFSAEQVRTIKSYDQQDRVFYIKSFSKSLMPGLRIACVQAPLVLQDRLRRAKQSVDLSSNGLMQRVLERFISSGRYDAHVAMARQAYSQAACHCIEALTAAGLLAKSGQMSRGGINFWLDLTAIPAITASCPEKSHPSYLSLASRVAQSLAAQGVLVAPEALFRHELPATTDLHLRLSYGSLTLDEIDRAVRALADVVAQIAKS